MIRNFLVTLKLFLNAKCSLSLLSKWQIGHEKWFLNTNLFLIKPFLITQFDCIWMCTPHVFRTTLQWILWTSKIRGVLLQSYYEAGAAHTARSQGRRKFWKSGGAGSNVVGIICPLLTDLPKCGDTMAPPPPTCLGQESKRVGCRNEKKVGWN